MISHRFSLSAANTPRVRYFVARRPVVGEGDERLPFRNEDWIQKCSERALASNASVLLFPN